LQLGLLLTLVGMVLLFVTREKEEDEEFEEEDKEQEEWDAGDADGGLIAKIKQLLGMYDEEANLSSGAGSSRSGAGSNGLKIAQEENAKGNIDLEELLKQADDVRKDVDFLAEGTTQVQQTVLWQIIDGEIFYRIVLYPYDREAHQMMMYPNEALFISFGTDGGERLVPKSAAMRIETRTLRIATKDGYAVGWFADGKLPLEGQAEDVVELSQVGWIFSGKLHARLQKLQRPGAAKGGAVKDPYGIKTGVE
jgi:hypothetical protein